jgi:hypothetical protein
MRNKRGRHLTKRPQYTYTAAGVWRRIVLGFGVAVSTTLFTPGILAQEATSSQASTGATAEQNAVAGQGAVAEHKAAQQRADEAPLEVTPTARPTLDYVPSETISEDSSVSFPVDI